ncbi:MAG: flagellar motor protein MotD [Rhodocyclaceae bacterium]|nr:flagellar motor protein MotD [Rhodocyclaceae bacterium]
MARRRQEDEHENHERWLVSYADFITLLFAFFVVMYAISQVNEGKYRVLSDALVSAFRNVPGATGGAQVALNPNAAMPIQIVPRRPIINTTPNPKIEEARRQNREKMRNIAKDVREALGPLVQEGLVQVTETALGITIDINASVLFAPGDARLDPVAVRALAAVGRILAPTDFPIIVEGHTDNTPISNAFFPSNWELSGVRASSVVRLFIDTGVDPRRLTATGHADQRPVADNASPDGRARNRRVAISIESQTPDAPTTPAPGLPQAAR